MGNSHYIIYKESSFSSAHSLSGHKGKCENIHGHNWRVRLYVSATHLDKCGMVIDFKDLKHTLNQIIEHFDHQILNSLPDFQKVNPTAENIAEIIFKKAAEHIDDSRKRVTRVTVWETDTSCASYYLDPELDLV